MRTNREIVENAVVNRILSPMKVGESVNET